MTSPASLQLFVFDDLPPHGFARLRSLLRENANVHFISPESALGRLVRLESLEGQTFLKKRPFPLAFGLGLAGERLARRLHEKNGLFPQITRLDIARIEIGQSQYEFAGDFAQKLATYGLAADDPVALVDDTVYSGGTVESILRAWPRDWQPKISLYCLQGIAASLERLSQKLSVHCAYPIAGVPEKDVSIIRLSGLFQPGSIRLKNGRELAFYQRPAWMKTWFPQNCADLTRYCAQLSLDCQPTPVRPWAIRELAVI